MNKYLHNKKISVIGIGYVGLPLSLALSKKYKVLAFDKNKVRINELKKGIDRNNTFRIKSNKNLIFTNDNNELNNTDIFIVTVPTPINKDKTPNLKLLIEATKFVSKFLEKGNFVIYESTVYPGTTDSICIPILESKSKLKINQDFFCGFSPERINPGDKINTINKIKKITSGSNHFAANVIDSLYKSILLKGTHKMNSIIEAESAKIIENVQRDINIAFMNELSIILNKLDINFSNVLKAASTKWNFLNFKPGLVGGHCISVDPYYLSYLCKSIGYNPKIINSGRSLNDHMPIYISRQIHKQFNKKFPNIKKPKLLILGFAYKKNLKDIRNSKVFDIYTYFKKRLFNVNLFDPLINDSELLNMYNIKNDLKALNKKNYYDGIIIALNHSIFAKYGYNKIKSSLKKDGIFCDFHNLFKYKNSDFSL